MRETDAQETPLLGYNRPNQVGSFYCTFLLSPGSPNPPPPTQTPGGLQRGQRSEIPAGKGRAGEGKVREALRGLLKVFTPEWLQNTNNEWLKVVWLRPHTRLLSTMETGVFGFCFCYYYL